MEETSEYTASEMPDILIPAVDVQMVVDDNPLVFNEDPEPTALDKYKEEMLTSGLTISDFEYFSRAYKNPEEVKYIKIHCTSCDKHLGSAADQRANRYEHPLLKVVICEKCYLFYSSGDFEKDEDGSELYCRWCGEGGDVYCCTKCPYVFCKKCIKRNLGRGTATLIQITENWLCFACSPSQIDRHRATYWAVQKYAEELIEMAKDPDSSVDLSIDGNICCISAKKRAENSGKVKTSNSKKSKLNSVNSNTISLPPVLPSLEKMPSTSNVENSFAWQSETNEEQDEVICTPDIIPIDDSPPSSPKAAPAPLVPLAVQPNVQVIKQTRVATMPPLRPAVPTTIQMAEFQKQLQTAFPQKIFITQPSQMSPKLLNSNPVIIKSGVANPAAGNFLTLNDNKYKFVISKPLNKPVQNVNTNYILTPVTTGNSISNTAMVQQPVQKPDKTVRVLNKKSDWFDQAVVHCAGVTDYISTKISSLSGVHTRAYRSEKLMEELHNTLQTYLHVAIEKLHKVKQTMKDNFENEKTKKVKFINPYNKRKRDKGSDESSVHCTSMSEVSDAESNYIARPKKRRRRKSSKCAIEMILPDDVPFDMTVTNASDEEQSMNGESRPDSPNDVELVGEIKTKGVSNEIISLLETTDDEEDDAGGGDNEEEENKKETKVEEQHRLENNEESPKESSDVSSVDKSSEQSNIEANNKSPKNSPGKSIDIKTEEILVNKENNEPNESQDDDGDKLLNNVDKKKNEEEVQASNTSDKSDEENLDAEEASENNKKNLTNNVEKKDDNETKNEVEFDVEEMLNSAVVPKSNNNASKSFGDVFSKFINGEETPSTENGQTSISIIDENDKIAAEVSNEKISETMINREETLSTENGKTSKSITDENDKIAAEVSNEKISETMINREETLSTENGKTSKSIADENEKMAAEVSNEKISESIGSGESFADICNDMEDHDNSCLSLPPDGLMEYYKDDTRKINKNINEHDNNATDKRTDESNNIEEGDESIKDEIKNDCKNKIVKTSDKNSSSSVKRAKKIKGKNKNDKKSNEDQSVIEGKSNSDSSKNDKGNNEVILDSEIMALKQMAENCVDSSVDVRKASAECKG